MRFEVSVLYVEIQMEVLFYWKLFKKHWNWKRDTFTIYVWKHEGGDCLLLSRLFYVHHSHSIRTHDKNNNSFHFVIGWFSACP